MSVPKVRSWHRIRTTLIARFPNADVPSVPSHSDSEASRETAWRATIRLAKANGAGEIVQALTQSDFCKTETFLASEIRPETFAGRVGELIRQVGDVPTWNTKKRSLVTQLIQTLSEAGYVIVNGHGVRYRVSHVGGSFLYNVPASQMGHLRRFRGKTVRVVCVKSGTRSDRTYMIGTGELE